MSVLENTITAEQMTDGLNIDMVQNFEGGMTPLLELLGIDEVETLVAGTAIQQYKVEGELNTAKVADGDETPLSQYSLKPVTVGTISVEPYRKLTTANAILKSGFVKAVGKTDRRMINQIRAVRIADYYRYLANGTTKTNGKTIQAALIYAETTLKAKLAKVGEKTERIIHYVNSFDVADYLASKDINLQTVSGMDYLENFLGIKDIFVTPEIPQGMVYVTPVENIHIYGVDFDELAKGGLVYEASDSGLIGVAHSANYARTSCETFAVSGMLMIAEVLDWIVVATIGDGTQGASLGDESFDAPVVYSTSGSEKSDQESDDQDEKGSDNNSGSGDEVFDPTGDVLPTMANKANEIAAFAQAHEIDLSGATNKTQQLEKIHAVLSQA